MHEEPQAFVQHQQKPSCGHVVAIDANGKYGTYTPFSILRSKMIGSFSSYARRSLVLSPPVEPAR